MRISSANAFTNTIANLGNLQSSLATQSNQLSSGLAVTHAGDNPLQAANAQRAIDRLIQLKAQQTALSAQQNSISTAGTALGSANTLLQSFRDLVVQAGNATNNASDRASLVQQMQSIQSQMLALANTQDSNGTYLFSGLQANANSSGAAVAPFAASGPSSTVQYSGTAGQNSPTQSAIPFTMNGQAIFMQVPPATNGVFGVTVGASNTAQLSTDTGSISPSNVTLTDNYKISFSIGNNSADPTTYGKTVYQVDDTSTGLPVVAPTVYNAATQPIAIPAFQVSGLAADGTVTTASVSLNVTGTPGNGDTLEISPLQVSLGGQNTGLLPTNITPDDFTVSAPVASAPAPAAQPMPTLSAPYQISFSNATGGGLNYTVTDPNNANLGAIASGPYTPGSPVQFTDPNPVPAGSAATGATVTFTVPANVSPAAGDSVQVTSATPSGAASIFATMQAAINGISNQASNSGTRAQSVATSLRQIDNCLNNLSSAQTQTGLWINQATSISTSQAAQSTQLTTDQANAQDVNMVSGLSQFQSSQQAYQVALQSYASIQKLSLFNYIG